MKNLIDQLSGIVGAEKVKQNEPMKAHTTFRIGGPAEIYIEPGSEEQLCQAVMACKEAGVSAVVVGNGSNLLVSDTGISGVVISTRKGLEQLELDGELLNVGAGVLLGKAASEAAKAGLGGLEFAAGIPGSVGGAVVMNAGAYGGEMKQVLTKVHVLMPGGELVWVPVEELGLGYRTSYIPAWGGIVTAAQFKLYRRDPEEIRAEIAELGQRRRDKQPLEFPSAGSTFDRPVGYFAGKLIQDAGLAGFSVGGAQVSSKHCGFVINKGGATAEDVLELCRQIEREVSRQFGVKLEMEIRKLGF